MGRCKIVTIDILPRIREALDCGPEDIMEQKDKTTEE